MRSHDYVRRYDALAVEDMSYEIPLRKEFLLSHIGRGKRVLDLGCGSGKITKLIREQKNDVWGVELNEEAAAVAREQGIPVKTADLEQGIPFEDASFDVVHAGELLEQIFDTRGFFKECHRVLKPAGVLLLSAGNLNSLENRLRVAMGRYAAMSGAYPEDHFGERIRHFNLEKLHELCEQTGFRIEDARGVPFFRPKHPLLGIPIRLASRAMPARLGKILLIEARKLQDS